MNISNVSGAYWVRAGSGKGRADKDNGFAEALAAESTKETAAEPVLQESSEPGYIISGTEINYFREKYGEEYNEDTAYKLYYELVEKGFISRNVASRASGFLEIMPLSACKSITYFGGGDPYGLRNFLNGGGSGAAGEKVYVKDVSRTDKDSPYRDLWNSFIKLYDRETKTWKDELQKTIDFERYVKENKSDADYTSRQYRDDIIKELEKTMDVISAIFD